jgi:hypothetical protein
MLMKQLMIAIVAVTLAGCAASNHSHVTRGKRGLHINCSGLSSTWEQCTQAAADACAPKNYKVIAKSGDAVEDPGDYLFGINPAGYTSRSMIVLCK